MTASFLPITALWRGVKPSCNSNSPNISTIILDEEVLDSHHNG
jgi:hypothetical protein